MNKIIKTAFVLGMTALMVTGCDAIQYKEVEYEEWHEKVSNLPESPYPSKLVIKGKSNDEVFNIVLKESSDWQNLNGVENGVIIFMTFMSGSEHMSNIKENANAKYYVSQSGQESYKLEDENDDGKYVATWDKYGNPTSYKDDVLNFTAKYTF